MVIKIIKKRAAPEMAEPAPLVEGSIATRRVPTHKADPEQTRPVQPVRAPDIPREPPASPGKLLSLDGESIFVAGHQTFVKYLEDRPHKLKQYIEAHKRPAGARTTACATCGHHYVLPCLLDQDRESCMNYTFLKKAGKV